VLRVEPLRGVCAADRRHRQPRSRLRSIFATPREFVALFRVWRERLRARHLLAAMTERQLQDIGTCWSDIVVEINKPFWLK
jgi:uncharacterized protein YjiS (DUF1127 family)